MKKAILGILESNTYSRRIEKYRIESDDKIEDIPVETIKEWLRQGEEIIGLTLINDIEIKESIFIPEIKGLSANDINLEDWCIQNKHRDILEAFEQGENYPICAKDIKFNTYKYYGFLCNKCQCIYKQAVFSKTLYKCTSGKCIKHKNSINLLEWCQQNNREDLIKEWSSKNKSMTEYRANSSDIVYWQDELGEWKGVIYSRTKFNSGNPLKSSANTSFAEQIIYKWLLDNKIVAYNRYWIEGREYDVYIPSLKLVIEHQSSLHKYENRMKNDIYKKVDIQRLSLNMLEICWISKEYMREENEWCITYNQSTCDLLHDIEEMTQKLKKWFIKNYNIHLNDLSDKVIQEAWDEKFKIKEKDSVGYRYPIIAEQWSYEKNHGISPYTVGYKSSNKFWLKYNGETILMYLTSKRVRQKGCEYNIKKLKTV